MKKLLLVLSTKIIKSENGGTEEIEAFLEFLDSHHIDYVFRTRQGTSDPSLFGFYTRYIDKILKLREVDSFLEDVQATHELFVVGPTVYDFIFASNKQAYWIQSRWGEEIDDTKSRYAIKVSNFLNLQEFLEVIQESNVQHYHDVLDDGTEIYSLLRANTYDVDQTTKNVLGKMQDALKGRNETFTWQIEAFLTAAVFNLKALVLSVDYFAFVPSSTVQSNGGFVEILMNRVRFLQGNKVKRQREPIIIRHESVPKSHENKVAARNGIVNRLESMHINTAYKGKLKGKHVLLLDDYLTSGDTIETAKALLKAAGVSRVTVLTLGKFDKRNAGYTEHVFNIVGDPYSTNFQATLVKSNQSSEAFRSNRQDSDKILAALSKIIQVEENNDADD